MIKLFLCLLAILVMLFVGGNKIAYRGPYNDFSMSISKNYKMKLVNRDSGDYASLMSFYGGSDTANVMYVMVMSKINFGSNVNVQEFLGDSALFFNGYESNCQCKVLSWKDVPYLNVKTKQMELVTNASDTGSIISFMAHNNCLYNISFVAKEDSLKKYKVEFKEIMNSFKFLN